jgi:hypothetical protein
MVLSRLFPRRGKYPPKAGEGRLQTRWLPGRIQHLV